MLNNVLLRNLHEESQRANANEERAGELQAAIRQYLSEETSRKKNSAKLKEYVTSSDEIKAGIVNYELELVRERGRADALHERNQELVKELTKVRQEMREVKRDNATLVGEIEKLQRLLKRTNQ